MQICIPASDVDLYFAFHLTMQKASALLTKTFAKSKSRKGDFEYNYSATSFKEIFCGSLFAYFE